jgi:hypothetical protein
MRFTGMGIKKEGKKAFGRLRNLKIPKHFYTIKPYPANPCA